jgi:1-acyl-sn-glycerol-3-phosphate acyltransferase
VGAVRRRIAILAKKSLFAIPIVGPAFRIAHFVPVDRSNAERALAAIDEAVMHMKNGLSFLIYPEGTRSADGRLRPFRHGAFVLAIKAGVPAELIACCRNGLIAFGQAKSWCAFVRRSTRATIRWKNAASSPNAYTTLSPPPCPPTSSPPARPRQRFHRRPKLSLSF